jgi:spore maturation protein CgeB
MRVAFFVHSLLADWQHGNSHFLRGVATELIARGHEVLVFEPRQSLIAGQGAETLAGFRTVYPKLASQRYDPATLDLDRALEDAGLVIVHEWSEPVLAHRIGYHRRHGGAYRLLFYDTHHRSVTHNAAFSAYGLADYDGVLASGAGILDLYLRNGWAPRVWTWHEAADTRVFYPRGVEAKVGDLVWTGNWGDDERPELREFLTGPVRYLGLFARVYGARYSEAGSGPWRKRASTTPAGSPTTRCRGSWPATPSPSTSRAAPESRPPPASFSRPSPAASRSSPPPGTTPKGSSVRARTSWWPTTARK